LNLRPYQIDAKKNIYIEENKNVKVISRDEFMKKYNEVKEKL